LAITLANGEDTVQLVSAPLISKFSRILKSLTTHSHRKKIRMATK